MLDKNSYKRVLPQLFDVKPMKDSVELDWIRIKEVKKILDLRARKTIKEMWMRREALIFDYAKKTAKLRENESLIFVKKDQNDNKEEAVNIHEASAPVHLLFDDYFAFTPPESRQRKMAVINNKINSETKFPLTGLDGRESFGQREDGDKILTQRNFLIPEETWRAAPPVYLRLGIIGFISIALAGSLIFPVFSLFNREGNFPAATSFSGAASSIVVQDKNDFIAKNTPVFSMDGIEGRDLFNKFLFSLAENGGRYLLIFQNSNEMRPTGGFLEYYGVLDMQDGQIKSFFIDDTLNFDGQIDIKVIPPRPVQKIATGWSLHDSNWFSDFPTSAEKAIWFYEGANDRKVDGIISFSPQAVSRILAITGSVNIADGEMEISGDNFQGIVWRKAQDSFDSVLASPRDLFIDFILKFIQKVESQHTEKWRDITNVFLRALEEKHILMYFVNEDAQNFILQQGWGGQMRQVEGDFLNIVSSYFNTNKNSDVINEVITHGAEIQTDGSIIDTVAITWKRRGNNIYNGWLDDNEIFNYVRLYAPPKSELLEVSGNTIYKYAPSFDYDKYGFQKDPDVYEIESNMRLHPSGTEIFNESGKTVFGNWARIAPDKSVTVSYKYKLPFKVDNNYSLTVQKQSGSVGSGFSSRVSLPENFSISDKTKNVIQKSEKIFEIEDVLKTDLNYRLIF